jgi:hypothetical protein
MIRPLIGVIAILVSHAAQAKDWYILDVPHNRCLFAAEAVRASGISELISPGEFADLIRHDGRTPTVKVVRDVAGDVIEADIFDRGTMLTWFATETYCDQGRHNLERRGDMASPEELH